MNKQLKTSLIIAGIFILIFYILPLIINDELQPKKTSTTENTHNSKALIEIKKEKKVVEAIITESDVIYVSVNDDGTNRNGYAEYLCQLLKEFKAKANRVKIIKVGSSDSPNKDNAYGILLGESNCN